MIKLIRSETEQPRQRKLYVKKEQGRREDLDGQCGQNTESRGENMVPGECSGYLWQRNKSPRSLVA